MRRQLRPVTRLLVPCLCALGACADGGEDERPQSEVRIAADHHMFGFRSLSGFGTFPVKPESVNTDRGTLRLFDNSTYSIERATGTTGADRYAIDAKGNLSVFVTGSGREPSVLFRGAYAPTAPIGTQNPVFFFTDRVSTPNSPSLGLYYGTRIVPGQTELEGAWHVLSLHTVFNEVIQSPDNVARGASGAVSIGAGAPGAVRTISGTGLQGTSTVTFGGTIQNLLDNGGNGNGTCNLTLSYQLATGPADARVCLAAAGRDLVFAIDADETDGEAGLVLFVRKFDAPATPIDVTRLPGRFLVGGHTVFVNSANAGSDTFVGTLTLTSPNGFRLEAVGNQGIDFVYTGTFTVAADGGLTFAVSGTNETWFAAIDRDYTTIAFVDGFVESRSNNLPELNFAIGVREKSTP
jgi:hypothetical protein